MSHIKKIELEINDLDALQKAASNLGLTFNYGARDFKWYRDQRNKCEHSISVPNSPKSYEVGISKKGDKYELSFDPYMGGYGLMAIIGSDCSRLHQEYSVEVAIKQLYRQGKRVERQQNANGTIRLVARGGR